MSEEKAAAEAAVEELAKLEYEAHLPGMWDSPGIHEPAKEQYRDQARRHITAIRPLLCGEPEKQQQGGDEVEGLPRDLVDALRDQRPTLIIDRDRETHLADGRTLAEHLEEWRSAPSNTASAPTYAEVCKQARELRIRAMSTEQELSEVRNRAAEALHWLRGGDVEAAEAALAPDTEADADRISVPTQPPSDPSNTTEQRRSQR